MNARQEAQAAEPMTLGRALAALDAAQALNHHLRAIADAEMANAARYARENFQLREELRKAKK